MWETATRVDTFYQLNCDHFAAPLSTLTTRYYTGWTHEALFFGSVIVNPAGVDYDSWIPGKEPAEVEWNADSEFAAHVGEDYWSVEYRMNFDGGHVPRPDPGDVWGGNLCRIYRGGRQYAQWVREYRSRRQGGFSYMYGSDNSGIWLLQ